MKKIVSTLATAVLAISTLTPTLATAMTEEIQKGVYLEEEFYSFDQFKSLLTSQKRAVLSAPGSVIVFDEKVVTGQLLLTATDAEINKAAIPVKEYEQLANITFNSGLGLTTIVVKEPSPPSGGSSGSITPVNQTKVQAIKLINAKQIKITFSGKIEQGSVIATQTEGNEVAGTLLNGVIQFQSLDQPAHHITADEAKAELSPDGHTLIITATGAERFEGRYRVNIYGAIDDKGKQIKRYKVNSLDLGKDTQAPGVQMERISESQVRLRFSEPVVIPAGALSATYADSTLNAIVPSDAMKIEGQSLSTFESTYVAPLTTILLELGPTIQANQDLLINLTGVVDMAGNPLDKQFSSLSTKRLPAFVAIEQTGNKTFTIQFKEDINETTLTAKDVTVSGVAASKIKKVSANTYELTMSNSLTGEKIVTVATGKVVDLSGQLNAIPLSEVVQFTFIKEINNHIVTVKDIVQGNDNDKVNVTFTIPDGASLDEISAKKKENYAIPGATIISVTIEHKSPTTKLAILHLEKGSNKSTANREITVKNVGIIDSTEMMDSFVSTAVELKENVRPELIKVEVTETVEEVKAAAARVGYTTVYASNPTRISSIPSVEGILDTEMSYEVVEKDGRLELVSRDSSKPIAQTNKEKGEFNFSQGNVNFIFNLPRVGEEITIITKAPSPEVKGVPGFTKISLTFSEEIFLESAAQFTLLVGGMAVNSKLDYSVEKSQINLVLNRGLSEKDFEEGVQLRPVTSIVIKDQAGNISNISNLIKLTK